MTSDEVYKLIENNGLTLHGDIEHFAELVAQRERDELTVMFLEAHEGAKDNHNYWHVAANKIKGKT
jgi:hypothetical protein